MMGQKKLTIIRVVLLIVLGVLATNSGSEAIAQDGVDSRFVVGDTAIQVFNKQLLIGRISKPTYQGTPTLVEINTEVSKGVSSGVAGLELITDREQDAAALKFHVHSGGSSGIGLKQKNIMNFSANRPFALFYGLDEAIQQGWVGWFGSDDNKAYRKRILYSLGETHSDGWTMIYGQLKIRPDNETQTQDLISVTDVNQNALFRIDAEGNPILMTRVEPPKQLISGLLVYADGRQWNPGFGAGFYGYQENRWIKLGD